MAGYIGSKAVTLSTTAADVTGDATINGNLTVNGTTITVDSAAAQEIRLGDNDKMTFGDATGGDLQIYHNGTTNYLYALADININANTGVNIQAKNGEESIVAEADGAVTLYYDNAAKLATTSTGISVTGNANFADNGKAIFGAGSDLQIFHDGSNSYVKDNGTGDLYLQGTANVRITNTSGQKMFLGQDGGEAQLYYNGVEKLATTSTGIDVTGEIIADSYNETYAAVTSSSNATTVDCHNGNAFSHTLTENTTFTFSNPPASGTAFTFSLEIIQDASASGYTVTWPSSVDWPSATAPTLTATASAKDVFVFYTRDGGTTWYGFTAGQALG